MTKIIGVRFQTAGKIYYFTTEDETIKAGDFVIVETKRGKDLGKAVIPPLDNKPEHLSEPLKPILRKATEEDINLYKKQQKRTERALTKCRELVQKLNIPMKPITAHYNFDGNHVVIYFIAEKRVDFRELVKELSHELKGHVELRQVGARDESKLIGGIGKCGLTLCCTTFLTEFNPISIKMAKEQDITLNPMKTSGLCGRLLCCLSYEYEQYKIIKSSLPEVNQEVVSPMGIGKVITINPLKQTVWVQLDSGASIEYNASELKWQKISKTKDTDETNTKETEKMADTTLEYTDIESTNLEE